VTTCPLCPSPVVADGLCVPCGAKLWAARLWEKRADVAYYLLVQPIPCGMQEPAPERAKALRLLSTPQAARAFLDKLDAARKAREAAPLCPDGCMSHEEER
jgi:hypothetical protein